MAAAICITFNHWELSHVLRWQFVNVKRSLDFRAYNLARRDIDAVERTRWHSSLWFGQHLCHCPCLLHSTIFDNIGVDSAFSQKCDSYLLRLAP